MYIHILTDMVKYKNMMMKNNNPRNVEKKKLLKEL